MFNKLLTFVSNYTITYTTPPGRLFFYFGKVKQLGSPLKTPLGRLSFTLVQKVKERRKHKEDESINKKST